MKRIRGNQKGFTLVEILVAIPIMALVGLAAVAVLIQLMHSGNITSGVSASRQVQSAGDWVSRDGLQFQKVTSGIAADNVSLGFPFTLRWNFWDEDAMTGQTHEVTYSLVPTPGGGSMKQLQRHQVITNTSDNTTASDTTITIARSIDGSPSATNCRWLLGSDGYSHTTFIFTVTATVGGKTESRAYQVMGRAAS
jgi:prepilin-type N-terminal cleavage/methylation domain-containing protein